MKKYDKYWLCDYCKSEIILLKNPVLSNMELLDKSYDFHEYSGSFDETISVCLHEGMAREMVHKLKYNAKVKIADVMAVFISEVLQKNDFEFDMIVPVPSHKKRTKKRGYNQAFLIAESLSNITSIPCCDVLCKVKDTKSQVLLNGKARWYNVKDAFALNSNFKAKDIKGLKILLVDDIITTGATAFFCSGELKKNGAAKVCVASFTRASC